jgi:hypothetical protein
LTGDDFSLGGGGSFLVEAECIRFEATGTDIELLASRQAPLVLRGEDMYAVKNPDIIKVLRIENSKWKRKVFCS